MPDRAAALVATLARTITDKRVLEAIASVPRDRFVPPALRHQAYDNLALPIDCGQTISQPLVVARMLELLELRGDEHVLDVGTGSGYHAALLARLARSVITVERHANLSRRAGRVLDELGVTNVERFVGDGTAGVPERAPYDAINVAAAADDRVPDAILRQLAPGGRLVAPIAADPQHPEHQWLDVLRWDGRQLAGRRHEPVRFVPLVAGAARARGKGRAGGA